jgi:hypothetical protein
MSDLLLRRPGGATPPFRVSKTAPRRALTWSETIQAATTTSSSPLRSTVASVTEPDPESLADAIRERDRSDRDAEIAQELESTDKVARELAEDED